MTSRPTRAVSAHPRYTDSPMKSSSDIDGDEIMVRVSKRSKIDQTAKTKENHVVDRTQVVKRAAILSDVISSPVAASPKASIDLNLNSENNTPISKAKRPPARRKVSRPALASISVDTDTSDSQPEPRRQRKKGSADIVNLNFSGEENTLSASSSSDIVSDILHKYNSLKGLRETDAEKLLNAFKKNSETRHKASEALIQHLKEENLSLKEQLAFMEKHAKDKADNERANLLAVQKELEGRRGNDLSKVREFYERLTGLKVTEKDKQTFQCTQTGKHGTVIYTLQLNEEEGGYDYSPVDLKLKKGVSMAYLEDDIFFPLDQSSLFYWRLLNFLQNAK